MGTPELTSPAYWDDEGIDIRLNPARFYEDDGLHDFLAKELRLSRSVVLATSGSSGAPKFAVLSKEAILSSARAVARHLQLTGEDSWLAGLSNFHVGGIGMYARAYVTGAPVTEYQGRRWEKDGQNFVEALKDSRAIWTSLTPTHLHDLVSHEARGPRSLRGVLLGGGPIRPALVDRAIELGWPVRASYGMTEACSQIATGDVGEVEWLPVLPEWEILLNSENRLKIRGAALFSGYAVRVDGKWTFDSATDEEGWFETGDQVDLASGKLRFEGRVDDLVKVSGELVSVSAVEAWINQILESRKESGAVATSTDPRRGTELVAFVEGKGEAGEYEKLFRSSIPGLERPGRIVITARLPRTDLGKVDRGALEEMVRES